MSGTVKQLESVPGQETLKEYFTEAVRRKTISHAYILEGEAGTPKRELAEAAARLIQCERGTGCGSCPSCRAFDAGNHPDVIRVVHEKPDTIRIDEIRRQLVDDIGIRPYGSAHKIYLVDEAEKMNAAAQNALLKTLEEPPEYGVILLITGNAEAFLPTIRSRAVSLKLTSPREERSTLTPEQQAGVIPVLLHAGEGDRTDAARAAKEWKDAGIPARGILDLIRLWIRDILVIKSTGEERMLCLPEEVRSIREAAERYEYPQLKRILTLTDRTERRILSNVNFELAMELLLAEMKLPAQEPEDLWENVPLPDEETLRFYQEYDRETEQSYRQEDNRW